MNLQAFVTPRELFAGACPFMRKKFTWIMDWFKIFFYNTNLQLKPIRHLLIFILCINFIPNLFAQTKIEEEFRIKPEEAPELAVQYVNGIFPDARIKWYLERGIAGTSIEAKLKQNGQRYSIEFDALGGLEDVEILIDPAEIPGTALSPICDTLSHLYSKYKITRAQRQLSGDKDLIKEILQGKENITNIIIRFELVIKGKTQEGMHLYEHLFDSEGQLLETARIITRNTDILNY